MTGLEELGVLAVAMSPGGAWTVAECAAVAGLMASAAAVSWHEVTRARRARRRDDGRLPPPRAEERRDGLLSPDDAEAWAAVERHLRNSGMGRAVAARVVRAAGPRRRPGRVTRTRVRTGK